MTTLELQRRLQALGFNPGPLDGIRGRLTIHAIKTFQAANGLAPDGLAGPATIAKLAGAAAAPSSAETQAQLRPWFEEARRLQGTTEALGPADNPVILRWGRILGLVYPRDSLA